MRRPVPESATCRSVVAARWWTAAHACQPGWPERPGRPQGLGWPRDRLPPTGRAGVLGQIRGLPDEVPGQALQSPSAAAAAAGAAVGGKVDADLIAHNPGCFAAD